MAQPTTLMRPRTQWSEAEWKTRVDLAACYRLADLNHMSQVIWNHITARIPGTDEILINRLGLRFDEIRASNLLKITIDGKVIDGTPDELNFTGYVIHGAVHKARPDTACVMHTHSRGGQGVAAMKRGLLPLTQESMMFFEDVAYHAYEGLSLDESECERLARDLEDKKQMVLRNHGLLTVGHTIAEAYWRMFYLERCCQAQMDVLATGEELESPPREVCLKAREQMTSGPVGRREWPALLRQLDKLCPDYKD